MCPTPDKRLVCQGEVPLKVVSIANLKNAYKNMDDKDALHFEISTNLFMRDGKARTFVLRASSLEEVDGWISALLNNIERNRRLQPDTPPPVGHNASFRRLPFTKSIRTKDGVLMSDPPETIKGSFIQKLVSKNKKRFEQGGFSLDLAYITPHLIAMGFPSVGREGLYRNHSDEVYRFFETRHSDKYKVYNLCSERTYDETVFHGRVARYPFDDHNPPQVWLCGSEGWRVCVCARACARRKVGLGFGSVSGFVVLGRGLGICGFGFGSRTRWP